jgi:L-cysteine/cystine lyase
VTPQEARAAYPVLARTAYLNAGTFGPLARATVDAVAASRRADVEEGRCGSGYFTAMLEARERVRAAIAGEIGVSQGNVALTRATTDGCNLVLNGLGLQAGDEVVTTDVEHFGLLGALGSSPARVRVAAVRDRPAAEAAEAILAEVGPRTRLVALSHVAWSTGHVLPVEEVKRETGLPVLVDGAQSVGTVPVDASPYDFYTVSGQKWLCTPDSLGALYVADPDALRVSFPSYFSQAGYEADGDFEPRDGAARFDTGWIAPGLLAGAEAALALHPPWRFERARELAARCRALLAERVDVVTEPAHATLVSFRAGEGAEELVSGLAGRGVVVRDMPGLGWIRVSCGYWNDEDDLERLLEGLDG